MYAKELPRTNWLVMANKYVSSFISFCRWTFLFFLFYFLSFRECVCVSLCIVTKSEWARDSRALRSRQRASMPNAFEAVAVGIVQPKMNGITKGRNERIDRRQRNIHIICVRLGYIKHAVGIYSPLPFRLFSLLCLEITLFCILLSWHECHL